MGVVLNGGGVAVLETSAGKSAFGLGELELFAGLSWLGIGGKV
jgi:hypothetical protein